MHETEKLAKERDFFPDLPFNCMLMKDYAISMHAHEYYEINVIVSGKGTHNIEGRQIPVRAGDVFVIPPLVNHSYTDAEDLDVYHVIMKTSMMEEAYERSETVGGYLQLMGIAPQAQGSLLQTEHLHLHKLQLEQLLTELEILDRRGMYMSAEYNTLKYYTLWKMIYWLSALMDKQIHHRGDPKHNRLQVLNIFDYIHHHYQEKITIDELCQITHLSRSTFLRQFKEVSGLSPNQYLVRLRCRKALHLMSLGDRTKTEAALECGFYDLSHMERALRSYGQSMMKNRKSKEPPVP